MQVQDVNKLLKQLSGNGPHDQAGLQARPEGPDAPRPGALMKGGMRQWGGGGLEAC